MRYFTNMAKKIVIVTYEEIICWQVPVEVECSGDNDLDLCDLDKDMLEKALENTKKVPGFGMCIVGDGEWMDDITYTSLPCDDTKVN